MAIVVTDDTFKTEVLESSIPVLVDFWADWCGPCNALMPTIEAISKEFEGKIKVVKININENQRIPLNFGVKSIPTLILFKNGLPLDTKIGMIPKNNIINWLNEKIIQSN